MVVKASKEKTPKVIKEPKVKAEKVVKDKNDGDQEDMMAEARNTAIGRKRRKVNTTKYGVQS